MWCALHTKFGVPASSKLAHPIWCAVHTFFVVCITHLIWCAIHTFLCVDSTLCVVCYYTAFCLWLAFTSISMYSILIYNLIAITHQNSQIMWFYCLMYLSTLYVAVIKVIVMGLLKHVQSLLLRQLTASSLMHTSSCLYVFVHFVCSSY